VILFASAAVSMEINRRQYFLLQQYSPSNTLKTGPDRAFAVGGVQNSSCNSRVLLPTSSGKENKQVYTSLSTRWQGLWHAFPRQPFSPCFLFLRSTAGTQTHGARQECSARRGRAPAVALTAPTRSGQNTQATGQLQSRGRLFGAEQRAARGGLSPSPPAAGAA